MEKTKRIPPQNLDAEVALLGAIFIRPDVLHEIISFFRSDFFYAEKHKMIYEAIMALFEKNEPIDVLTVANKLKEQKTIEAIGGNAYLAEISAQISSSSNAEYFAREIYKKYMLRQIIAVAHKIGELAYEEEKDLQDIIEQVEQKVYETTKSNTAGKKAFVEIKETLEEAWKRIEKMHERSGELRGITTGFKELNNLLSGWQKGDLIILAARPSVGKTSLALDFLRHASVGHGVPVAFFSLEMSKEQLVDRLVSAESRVDSWKLRTGSKIYDNEWAMLQESLNRLSAAPIFIDDEPGITPVVMRSKLRRMFSRAPIGLVIVDYLQLMNTTKNYDSMVNQVTEISRSLKAIAKEFSVPVIALSQLSRAVESRGGKPKLSDLRDSGSIEQDADVVMFIHREDKTKSASERGDGPLEAEILIEKHRNGPTGYVKLHFDSAKTTFISIDKQFTDFTTPPETAIENF